MYELLKKVPPLCITSRCSYTYSLHIKEDRYEFSELDMDDVLLVYRHNTNILVVYYVDHFWLQLQLLITCSPGFLTESL